MGADGEHGRPRRTRIGVTGHRRFLDEDDVRVATAALLDELIVEPDDTTLVSLLAEGADRLVAELALAHPGTTLTVLLPLARSDYERDFDTPASRAAFAALLDRADSVAVVTAPDGEPREASYEAAGRAMVEQCTALVALWDAGTGRGRGGTAEVVAYARSRGCVVRVIPVRRVVPS